MKINLDNSGKYVHQQTLVSSIQDNHKIALQK